MFNFKGFVYVFEKWTHGMRKLQNKKKIGNKIDFYQGRNFKNSNA